MKHRPEVFRSAATDCGCRPNRRRNDRCTAPRLRRILAAAVALIALAAVGCERPLPEQSSPAAQLYANRCGQCHRAYAPGSLTPAMWQLQVELMETKMRQDHVRPLTEQQRDTILRYLTRNAARD